MWIAYVFILVALAVTGTHAVDEEECIGDLVWNDCGSECTKNCENYADLACIAVCKARCECPTDRPIFHNGRCITADQCPTCDMQEVEACQQTCADQQKVPVPGTECGGNCQCQEVCKDYNCGDEKKCKSKQVQCVRAPCPPMPECEEKMCEDGEPLMNEDGTTFFCGRGGERCPVGFECSIHPTDRWAVCCLDNGDGDSDEDAEKDCDGDMVWTECASACLTTTCANHMDMCIERCDPPKCQCPADKPVLHEGRCITSQECPACGTAVVDACKQKCAEDEKVIVPGTECGQNCRCQEVCEADPCEEGYSCETQIVQCIRAPCEPQANCTKTMDAAPTCDDVEICQQTCADEQKVPVPGTECDEDCSCQDVCKDHTCAEGYMCMAEIVQCVKAPCPPQPTCLVQGTKEPDEDYSDSGNMLYSSFLLLLLSSLLSWALQ